MIKEKVLIKQDKHFILHKSKKCFMQPKKMDKNTINPV